MLTFVHSHSDLDHDRDQPRHYNGPDHLYYFDCQLYYDPANDHNVQHLAVYMQHDNSIYRPVP